MRKWYWSYAIHGLVWAVLAFLALHVKMIAHAPIAVMFFLAYFPYWLMAGWHGVPPPRSSVDDAYSAYVFFWLLLGGVWLVVGTRRWAKGQRGLMLLAAHGLVAFVGWFCMLLVGSINFPFSL